MTLHVKYQSAEDEVSGKIDMPVLPYHLTFSSPADAEEVTGKTSLSVNVSGGGDTAIEKVEFLANKVSIGSASTPPYGVDWDPSGLNAGPVTLEAVAQDASGNELARSSITISYKPASVIPAVAPTLISIQLPGWETEILLFDPAPGSSSRVGIDWDHCGHPAGGREAPQAVQRTC